MITSLAWIPKGAARARPVRFELSSSELKRVKQLAKVEEKTLVKDHIDIENDIDNNNKEEDESIDENLEDDEELPPELRMNEYDDDDDDDEDSDDEMDDNKFDDDDFDDGLAIMEQGNTAYADEDEWEEEDIEDNEIKPNDALIVVSMTEDEFSHLEIQLFSEEGQLYVHHDITLPDFPLALAWLDCPPFLDNDGVQTSIGNYIAVGTFSPAIEIWNLDVLDPLEPSAILGGEDTCIKHSKKTTSSSKKKSKKQTTYYLPGSHEAAVMSLSWNTSYRQVLASGSADTTVKIWDITTQTCSHSFTHHTDKVQSIQWHPTEAWLLATGSFDKTISFIDARSNSTTLAVNSLLTSDVEALTWNPYNPYHLYCSLEDGNIICIDVRQCTSKDNANANQSAIKFSFQAHEQTTSAISFSARIPGMLATASIDKTVKVWDVNTITEEGLPKEVAYKTMNVGKLFTMAFNPDDPFLLAAAGDTGMLAVWESDELQVIENYFKNRLEPHKNSYNLLTTNKINNSINTKDQNKDITTNTTTTNNNNNTTTGNISIYKSNGILNNIETILSEPIDESWMDDNTDTNVNSEIKKKKKKKKSTK